MLSSFSNAGQFLMEFSNKCGGWGLAFLMLTWRGPSGFEFHLQADNWGAHPWLISLHVLWDGWSHPAWLFPSLPSTVHPKLPGPSMASPVWASPSRISRGVGIRSFVFLGGEVPSPTPMQNYKKHKLKKELLILTLSLQKSSVLQKIIFVHLKKKNPLLHYLQYITLLQNC